MNHTAIVVHYNELWLKGGNRRFFLSKLYTALRSALSGLPIRRIDQPGDRFVVRLEEGASLTEVQARIGRVFGVAYYAVARPVDRDLEALCRAAWQEIEPLPFETFAVRAKRSDKRFPHGSIETEVAVGRYLQDRLRELDRSDAVKLKNPDVTCHIEITPGPLLVYAKKIAGPGGLPPNTAGRITCLLSGGFDSAVAAYQVMKRGAHVSFVHFYGTGARPGESSLHVVRNLVKTLTPYQFRAKLYRVPFEGIQREIVRFAPERVRVLLYRRMMLRIAEVLARRERALALVTGDSLAQVASQTLRNLASVDAAGRVPVFRPLIGTDKADIMAAAKKIGTYDISSEPFHDCCPVFLPRSPELSASAADLTAAESGLDLPGLITQGLRGTTIERFAYAQGHIEVSEAEHITRAEKHHAAVV